MRNKYNFVLVSVLVFSIQLNAQVGNSIKSLIDTSFVLGIINNDTFAGDTISDYCSVGFDKSLSAGTIVFVSGAKKCKKSYSSDDFYEIYYRNKKYYIDREKVDIKDYGFDDFINLSEEQASSFRERTAILSASIYFKELNSVFDFLKNCKSKGLAIIEWSYYDESEYTEGTSVDITIYNPTNKKIKYLWFNFIGYNPVNDRVIDYRTGKSLLTRKAVGPIEKEETGSYEFSYVWMTDAVEKVKIASIRVQYMDGTEKIINMPTSIMLTKEQRDLLNEEQ